MGAGEHGRGVGVLVSCGGAAVRRAWSARVVVCNLAGGDARMTRWAYDGDAWMPSGRAVRHFRALGVWADVRPVTGALGSDLALRVMREAVYQAEDGL